MGAARRSRTLETWETFSSSEGSYVRVCRDCYLLSRHRLRVCQKDRARGAGATVPYVWCAQVVWRLAWRVVPTAVLCTDARQGVAMYRRKVHIKRRARRHRDVF